jgi:rare lipoprotein A
MLKNTLRWSVLSLWFLVSVSSCKFVNALLHPESGSSQGSDAQVVSVEHGEASYYADKYDGRPTASGEIFRQNALTAAHRTLPFGTRVRVTNLSNQKSITVRINDRGPFVKGRIIDLSKRGAQELDFVRQGITKVKVEVLKN